jgi:ankyrin repeat protein
MKKLYSGCFLTLLLLCIFNGCDECVRLPERGKTSFEVLTDLDKNTLYLEVHDMAKITLTIDPVNELAQRCEYMILEWKTAEGMQGQLLDQNMAVITSESRLVNGDNILYYNPLKAGGHTLKLTLADQHRLSEKEVTIDSINVKEKKELPFSIKLKTPSKSIFTHQEAKLALSISSKEKEMKEEAKKLTYSVKEIAATKGTLYLESTGEVIQKDTRLDFGKQTLLFKPSNETGEAHVKLLVESNKGGEAVVSIFLTIKPIDFKVSALLKEAPKEVTNHIQEDIALLEIMLSDIDPALMEEPWKLSSWRCSDGVIRDILNEGGEELSVYPLSSKEKNKLYVKLNDLSLDAPHLLTLAIEGSGKTTKEVNLPLSTVLKSVVNNKAQALRASSEQKNKKAKDYLDIPAEASNYQAIKEAQEEVEKDIEKLTEIITSVKSNYGQAAAMPSIAANHLKKAQRNIASLEKKKNKLDKLKIKSSKERASFEIALEARSKAIYAHTKSVIDMYISSDSPLSAKQTYQVKNIAVSKGELVLENNHETVKVDTKLTFGTQRLIFIPSGELGEAVINLTVANDKGTESHKILNLDVKAVSFKVDLEANAKSMFSHQEAEVELVISSKDEKEAENLVYSIKEVQGSLSLKSTGEKLAPGTKLHYGSQTLLYKPDVNPKVISEYQALLKEKKSLSLTQGDKKDRADQAAEGAGEVVAINTRIEDLKLVIQSSKELVVKPLGNIEANLSLSVTSQEGGEDKSLVILDVKPVGFQLGATAREAQEDERELIAGDFVVVELELSQLDPSIEKEGWKLSFFQFNDKTDPNNKIDAVIVDKSLRNLPSYELKTDGKNVFYLKLDNVDIHKFFELILTVEGPSEATRSVIVSLASAYHNIVQQQIAEQISAIKKEQQNIITFLRKAEEKEYKQLLSIIAVVREELEGFKSKYEKLSESKTISILKEGIALKDGIKKAINEFELSIERLEKEEQAWQAIGSLGNVEELAGYINTPNEAGNYLLHMWAEKEPISTEIGKFILKRTSDINCVNREGKTTLQLAIDKKDADKVNLLLKHKADVNVKFADGRSPLLYTSEKEQRGEHALTEALLKAGANPNMALDSKGLVPLHVALRKGDIDKVNLLLKHKADVNVKFADGKTALLYALESTVEVRHALLSALLEHKADVNVKFADGKSPLLYALEKEGQGEHALTEALLKAEADPNIALDSKGLMPLHVALQKVDIDKATLLLKYKASPNSKFSTGETPLAYVIENTTGTQRVELMRVLIQHGADQDALEINKLLSVIEQLSKDINGYLAEEIKERKYDPLKLLYKQAKGQVEHFNKTLGSVESEPEILGGTLKKEISNDLKKMIDKAIPELRKELERAQEEYNAWHKAIKDAFDVRTEQEIEKYVQHIYTADKDGNFLIHMWADKGTENQQAGEFIIQRTFDINAKNNNEAIPLHLAIDRVIGKEKDLNAVNTLLKYNADTNIRFDGEEHSVFRVLRWANNKDVNSKLQLLSFSLLYTLLENGASADVNDSKGYEGYTPLLFVIKFDSSNWQKNKVEALLNHGASLFKHTLRGGISIYYKDLEGWTPLHGAAERGLVDIVELLVRYGAKRGRANTARIFTNGYEQKLSATQVMDEVDDWQAKERIFELIG